MNRVVRPVDDEHCDHIRSANDIMQRPPVARPRPNGARWLLTLLGSLSLVGCHRGIASHGHHRRHGHFGLTLPPPVVEVDAGKLEPMPDPSASPSTPSPTSTGHATP